ncbi:MAG: cytochrome o ubiquinol oxidase subunit II [Candidatus Doudnabacteria bacterium]
MPRNKDKIIFALLVLLVLGLSLWILSILNMLPHFNFTLFNPKGVIGEQEKKAIILPFLLILIVVVPVLTAAVWVAVKYGADNYTDNTDYQPEWVGNNKLQILWWAFPATILLCVCFLTWKYAHAVDPFKELQSNNTPITIQVVALNWKWLFIYPEQNIATVNFLEFPENTPLNFVLTADAPMNSFWIPQLGSQMYAMPGMTTHLHLMANGKGEYKGSAVEINGPGYSDMNFKAKSVSEFEFEQWLNSVHQSPDNLTPASYAKLAESSLNNPVLVFASTEPNLIDSIIKKYLAPQTSANKTDSMPGMEMK